MNWHEILDIPYDSDLKTIKKAYAKLLKIYNPEDDPEGYQRLREAYDTAIKYAKNNEQQNLHTNLIENISDEVSMLEDEADVNEEIIKRQYRNIDNSYEQQSNNNINKQIEEFLDKVNELYNDDSLKKDIKTWEELLNMDVIWNVYSAPIIEDYMFEFLVSHKDLPLNIWYVLDYYFNWTKKERNLYKKYDIETVEEVFKTLQNISQLKYEYIKQIDPYFIEKYLSLRSQGYKAFKSRDYYEAQECLLSAYEIFTHDAELLKLIGHFYYKINDLDKSLEFYKLSFEINKFDLDVTFNIGLILSVNYYFSEALPYLKMYLSANSNDINALYCIASCYYFTGNLVKAKEIHKRILELKPRNRKIKKSLKSIEAELEGKNVKPVKFKKRKPKKKKVIKKKNKRQKTETSIERSENKVIIILIIIAVLFCGLSFMSKAPANKNHNKISTEYQYKNDIKNELNPMMYLDVIYLDDVKPTDYFKISEKFEGKNILSRKEIEDNNLQNKIESNIYVGTSNSSAILFADKNYNEDAANKNAKYKIEGTLRIIDEEIYESIKTQYESQNGEDKDWIDGLYIDCSLK